MTTIVVVGRQKQSLSNSVRVQLKCDGTCAETRIRLLAKRNSPFKSAGASVQSTTDSRGVRISGSNAGYTMSRGSVKGTGYPLHSPVSPSLPLPCVTVCHHISTGVYLERASDGTTAVACHWFSPNGRFCKDHAGLRVLLFASAMQVLRVSILFQLFVLMPLSTAAH